MPGDRRAARASESTPSIAASAVGLYRARMPVIFPALAGLDDLRSHRRQLLGEPLLQLQQELLRIVEQAVDQVDELSAQAFVVSGRKRLPVTLGAYPSGSYTRTFCVISALLASVQMPSLR